MNYRTEQPLIRRTLICIAIFYLSLFIFLPLSVVFFYAFQNGLISYFLSFTDPYALSAIRLTIFSAFVSVIFNLIFGISASWAIAKFNFWGKDLLNTLIDLPLSVSPVISGLIFVMIFGAQGIFGRWFIENDLRVIFTPIAIILATTFVTFPLIARELIPVMKAQGNEEEEAAITLGASGFQTFWMVTLPNMKWGLLYGVIICNARAMGEFGAVSVVSGHIRGQTNTLPLHIEILYNEYHFTAAFATASLLVFLAIITLIIKSIVENKYKAELKASLRSGD